LCDYIYHIVLAFNRAFIVIVSNGPTDSSGYPIYVQQMLAGKAIYESTYNGSKRIPSTDNLVTLSITNVPISTTGISQYNCL